MGTGESDDALSNAFSRDPAEREQAFAALQARCPMHRLGGGELFAVSREAVNTGLQHVTHFTGSFGARAQAEEDTILAAIPEPRHAQIRKIFLSALTQIGSYEPFIRALAAQLAEETLALARHNGTVEIMASLGRRLPSAVIAHLLGLPPGDFETFARWSDELLRAQGDGSADTPLRRLHPEFSAYLQARIAEHLDRPDPPDDVITRLARTEIEGEPLTRNAIETQMIFFIVAGNETTRNLIGNLLARLAGAPALYGRMAGDRTLIGDVIEETLRLDSPVQLLARTCTDDIALDGAAVAGGERVLFSIAAANRDPAHWAEPDRFDPGRARGRTHLAFGTGPHICPGATLARLEARVVLEVLLERVATLDFAPGHSPDPNPVVWANGPQTLWLTLTPR